MRQTKTNICLIAFPIVLSLALFGSQYLIYALAANSERGRYSPAVPRPAVTPNYLFTPLRSSSCPDETGLKIDTSNGKIIYAEPSLGSVGVYGGPVIPASVASLLPPGFVPPNPGPGVGLLGNMSTPLTSFLSYPVLVDTQGRVQDTCTSNPSLVYPDMQRVSNRAAMDQTVLDTWGKSNIMSGIDFQSHIPGTTYIFDVMYNFTLGSGIDLPIFVNLVSNAVFRTLIGPEIASTDTYLTNTGRKDYPRGVRDNAFNLLSVGTPNLYIYIFLLILPITMENLVVEKETRLRETMKMMGLKSHVYFFATYIWNYFLYICIAAFTVIIGLILQFPFYLDNSFWTYFFLFIVWGHTLVAMSWLLAVFITSSRTAIVLGYAIILCIGLLCTNLIRDIILDPFTPASTLFGVSVLPPIAFFRGLNDINSAIAFDGPGMSLSEARSYGLATTLYFLVVEWIVMLILAIYFEFVLPIGPGAKKHPLFFIPKKYRCCTGKDEQSREEARLKANLDHTNPSSSKMGPNGHPDLNDEEDDKPEDVLEEERKTLNMDESQLVVKAVGLHKVYTRGGKKKVAVRSLTMGIKNGECFGFLGPNGAGKSTTISMLCGYLRPTSGNAYINGLSIKEDMDDIHLQMGVCPQDDALWPSLTGPEHLEFYGRLKNLSGKALKEDIQFWLDQVNLGNKKTKRKQSSEYSGGMKRRLSVACAMIGNPSVVLLDEPTTGLDPASRIALWDVVRKFKSGCAMMLTTHSMEEAEALCDRLGIFVAGRLKTIGRAPELKDRYGRYYKIQMTTQLGNDAELLSFLQSLSPKVKLLNSLAGTNNFEVPSDSITLSKLFKSVEDHKAELGITNWAVMNTTLEEVFLKVTANEVQDEALKFAKKKQNKKKSKFCCFNSSEEKSQHQADQVEMDEEAQIKLEENGEEDLSLDRRPVQDPMQPDSSDYEDEEDAEEDIEEDEDQEESAEASEDADYSTASSQSESKE